MNVTSARLEEQSLLIKTQTVNGLETDIASLHLAVEERTTWLNTLSVDVKPVFTRAYTAKITPGAVRAKDKSAGNRLYRVEEKIITARLTREQLGVVAAIQERHKEDVERATSTLQAEYAEYMTDNPAYAGLSDSETLIAEQDLDKYIKSTIVRLQWQMKIDVEAVTAEVRARRHHVASCDDDATVCASVEEHRRDSIVRYKTLRAELQAAEDAEMACFDDEDAVELSQRGASDADVKKYRQDALESCRKTNTDKLQRLSRSINREVRVLTAEDRESAVREQHRDKLTAMMTSYKELCTNIEYAPSVCSHADKQQDVANTIDLGFEQSDGDWSSFMSLCAYYLSMLDQSQQHKDRLVRLYAVCLLSTGGCGPVTGAVGELESQIESLRQQRNTLMRDVRFLDARVKARRTPKQTPAPVAKKSPQISRFTIAYMAYCDAAPPAPSLLFAHSQDVPGSLTVSQLKSITRVKKSRSCSYALREARDRMI